MKNDYFVILTLNNFFYQSIERHQRDKEDKYSPTQE